MEQKASEEQRQLQQGVEACRLYSPGLQSSGMKAAPSDILITFAQERADEAYELHVQMCALEDRQLDMRERASYLREGGDEWLIQEEAALEREKTELRRLLDAHEQHTLDTTKRMDDRVARHVQNSARTKECGRSVKSPARGAPALSPSVKHRRMEQTEAGSNTYGMYDGNGEPCPFAPPSDLSFAQSDALGRICFEDAKEGCGWQGLHTHFLNAVSKLRNAHPHDMDAEECAGKASTLEIMKAGLTLQEMFAMEYAPKGYRVRAARGEDLDDDPSEAECDAAWRWALLKAGRLGLISRSVLCDLMASEFERLQAELVDCEESALQTDGALDQALLQGAEAREDVFHHAMQARQATALLDEMVPQLQAARNELRDAKDASLRPDSQSGMSNAMRGVALSGGGVTPEGWSTAKARSKAVPTAEAVLNDQQRRRLVEAAKCFFLDLFSQRGDPVRNEMKQRFWKRVTRMTPTAFSLLKRGRLYWSFTESSLSHSAKLALYEVFVLNVSPADSGVYIPACAESSVEYSDAIVLDVAEVDDWPLGPRPSDAVKMLMRRGPAATPFHAEGEDGGKTPDTARIHGPSASCTAPSGRDAESESGQRARPRMVLDVKLRK
jgi:hypothetical protein